MYKNYNTSELELDITTYLLKLPSDHIAVLISHFVDSILLNILSEETSHTGRPAFHLAMLLKMTLFAYHEAIFSGRKIAKLNQYYLPMMWLSGNTPISYKTINNFRSSDAIKELIKETDIKLVELEKEIEAKPKVKKVVQKTNMFVVN
ncbi:transposase [Ligilactobacillus sp. Marseille-Q7487]|uniref:transposase n=1 Tax=Ligilactobacillus sp. Marseille-Q7487 TaxID=3022128 RepID=UPI0032C1B628